MSSIESMMEDDDSYLSNTDAIIYGTSDHSGWGGDSMISDPNIALSTTSTDDHYQLQISIAAGDGGDASTIVSSVSSSSWFMNNNKQSDYQQETRVFFVDYRATSGFAICQNSHKEELEGPESSNRLKSCAGLELGLTLNIAGALNNGTRGRLFTTLMACADAVQQNNLNVADILVRDLKMLAAQQFGAKKKVATYFAQALDQRIHGTNQQHIVDYSYYTDDLLWMIFYKTCPYIKFAYLASNQAILDAFANSNRVHVIDFSLKEGLQWPALMEALARRPGGPPAFWLTALGPLRSNNINNFQQIGGKLAKFAETVGVEFEFREILVNSLADVDATVLNIRPSSVDAVAVNSVFELHHALSTSGTIEKLLNSIKEMQPKIVTITEQEANHNGHALVDRFKEAWDYYSTMFESMENSEVLQPNSPYSEMVEKYLGRQINNVVACEGTERVERHETLSQWQVRMNSAGFVRVHLRSNTYNQARSLLLQHSRAGYKVEVNDGCMLSWNSRPLIAISAWQLAPPSLG